MSTLLFLSDVHAQTSLINSTASWKYLDNGSNQGSNWRTSSFNDSSWQSGSAELGFGDSPITSLTPANIGYYFRKIISISNVSLFSDFTMKIRRDDGIVIYVNNLEVYRNNMPSGIINYNTKATSTCSDDGSRSFTITLSKSLFTNGNNIVAAEVHNYSKTSSDITFEIQLIANLLPKADCLAPNEKLFGNRNVTSTTAEVFWDPVPVAISYSVEYRIRNAGINYSIPFNTNLPSIVLRDLQPSTNYEFIVLSNCQDGGVSLFSQSSLINTLADTLLPPECSMPDKGKFTGSNISSTSVTISWSPVPGALSYNFEYRSFDSPSSSSILINTSSDSIVLFNLQPSTFYEFNLQSVCSENMLSEYSSTMYVSTLESDSFPECKIVDTSLFDPGNITSTSAELHWDNIPGAESYNVKYRILNSDENFSEIINAISSPLVLSNLIASSNYEYIIQTVCTDLTISDFTQSSVFKTLEISGSTAEIIRGPYMPVSTSTGITIQWRTNPATNTEVKYGTDTTFLNNKVNSAIETIEHSITLEQLLPNTKYYYTIGEIDYVLQWDTNNYFYTAPAEGSIEPVKFWVTGDFGNGGLGQLAVRNSFTNNTSGQKVNGWLWLGDNAYSNGTDLDYQEKVFNVYKTLFKNIPVFPSPGNHDYAQKGYQSSASLGDNFPYFKIFTLPSVAGTEKYYSTNYASIHFISLDSYGSYNNSSSDMYKWLSNDLENNTQQWTIVYFHHPPYTKGSHNSDTEIELIDMRNNIIPLLESYGVDLVISGHSHIYERSNFIKGHKGLENTFKSSLYPTGNIIQAGGGPYIKFNRTGNGTVYVVCGVSGQSGGSTMTGYPHNAMFKSNITSNGSLILEVNGENLTCKYLTSSGSIDDQFTIQKPNSYPGYARGYSKLDKLEIVPFMFPNPSTGDINIRINPSKETKITVSIYTATGSILFNRTYSKVTDSIILITKSESNLSPGLYIVNMSGENINTSEKLVIY